MARPKNHNVVTCNIFVLFLSTVTLAAVVTATDSSLCTVPSPTPKHIPAGKEDALPLLRSFQLGAGYFSGGEDIHFSKDEGDDSFHVARSFSLLPHSVDHTADANLLHVAATLTLFGGRARHFRGARRRNHSYVGSHSVSFYLDGYYSSASAELCMAGSGTYSEEDGSLKHLHGVVLKLRVPNPPSLSDPFVTGRLKGAGFETISLAAYAEGYSYRYGERRAACPPSPPSSLSTARGAFHALGANISCARIREYLVSWYNLQYGGGAPEAASSSPLLLPRHERRMHVGHVQCTESGNVRAYAVFSNDTNMEGQLAPRQSFLLKEEAVVAEGRWVWNRNMLCLRACRVVSSASSAAAPSPVAVQEKECDIGMSFWFPGVWTIHDRSAIAGMLWNTSQAAAINGGSGAISASSIDVPISHRANFSDLKYGYDYTMVEEAKKHYLTMSNSKKKVNGSFIAPSYTTYHDFEFSFFVMNSGHGQGEAYPVTIGPVMVYGDRLAADDFFSRHAMVEGKKHELLNVSYDIRHYAPPAGWVPPKNHSYSVRLEERRIAAEGVYDPETGILCMIGCRELNGSTTETDCQMLVTIEFASLESKAREHGRGVISSLRDKADPLFFDKMDIRLFGMYAEQVSESISRMDMESVMLVVSATLPCVFAALQILHAKRSPEAAAATSVTMLAVLALGYVAPLVLSSGALFVSRRRQYAPFQGFVPYEVSEAMMRAPALIAFVLQLRLLQLTWSARASASDSGRAAETSAAAAERRALWVCLPLYLLGGALTVLLHVMNGRAAREDSLAVSVDTEPATLWEDLVSSAGLALDGFLLPQVAMNAFSAAGGGGVARAISPWFYAGGTVVRAMPHAYDVVRTLGYVPSLMPSYVYAGPRDDRFGVAWDVVVPCVTAALAVLLFLQQRRPGAGAFLLGSRRSGGYEMVSTI